MPRRATHLLRWSSERGAYELCQQGVALRPPLAPDTPGWFAWLAEVSSFSFQRASGEVATVRKEKVQRGGAYWYAYHRTNGRMTKRYLGRDADLTLARLEADPPASGRYVTNMNGHRGARRRTPVASDTPLLATRMLMPRTPARIVSRTHVWHRLQCGLERPLTLLTAPAGFGKTTSLAAWVRQVEAPVAWISLDISDNDPGQFWAYVLSSLEQTSPGVTGGALAMLRSLQSPPLPVILRALQNALVASPRAAVLVLDDYHRVTSPAIHETLATLLEHPPAQLHLYIASRHESPLPLARLRSRDEVNEIHADDLRFRLDEVADFLGDVMDVQLPFADVLALAERTDGWIAGLQLDALSIQRHPDPTTFVASFSGSHRHIMQYLGDEVLAAQPTDIREFLLRTAVLDRLYGPLCDALTGQTNGRAMLERLAQANLFVVALYDDGRWYRYYHLFADLLRHRLRAEAPELLPELHQKAARWLEADGQRTEAANHLFAIPDYPAAADLAERTSDDLLRSGDIVGLTRLLEQVPEDLVSARPVLALTRAEACYARGELAAADRHITDAEVAVAAMDTTSAENQHVWRRLTGRIACDRAVLSSMRGDADATFAYVQTMQERLPKDDSLRWGGAAITIGHAWRLKGNLAAADEAYAEAFRISNAEGSPFLAALAIDMRTLVANARGELRLAANLSRQIIAMAESRGEAARSLAGNARTNLGWRLYEWNDLDGAEGSFHKALALGEQWGDVEDQVEGHLWLTLVYQARGEHGAARDSLQRARDLLATVVQHGQSFPWLPPLVAAASVRIAIAQGRLAEAERWMTVLQNDHRGNATVRPTAEMVYARVLLAQRNVAEAQSLLDAVLPQVATSGQEAYEIEICMLQALAWQAAGDTAHALETLASAIARAMPEGFIRLFLDEGAPMIALLRLLRDHRATRPDVADYCTKLLVAAGAEGLPTLASGRTHPDLPEPLSAREREVLDLLAEGYSNQEIANQLVVALSTIKTHAHHLYAKLQAPDRLRAVTRARALGLLDRGGDHDRQR